ARSARGDSLRMALGLFGGSPPAPAGAWTADIRLGYEGECEPGILDRHQGPSGVPRRGVLRTAGDNAGKRREPPAALGSKKGEHHGLRFATQAAGLPTGIGESSQRAASVSPREPD